LLDSQLTYLKTNGYSTITTEELHDYLYNKKKIPPNTIMLTFDDARASLWTIVFPLLKKYNFKCVTYLSPYPITNGETLRRQMPLPTDHASRVFTAVDSSPNPFVTWEECSVMHNSGLVDFQGHTYYHEQIYVSSKIVDFINPQYPKLFYNYDEPVISATGRNNYSRELSLGCPVYEMRPRMNGLLRYFDDEDLRHHCTAYVKNNGGHQFFKKFLWRRRLRREIKNYLQSNNDNGRYETRSEMEQYIARR
jgi:hypothetical protein